jgi:hypothetical protein
MQNHNVILYVDTKNITKKTIDENSSFDQYNMDSDNFKFKTTVKNGDSITWLGLSISSPNDKVIITQVRHENESNVFGRKKLYGDCCNDSGKVIGTVRTTTKKEKESYSIFLKICEGDNGGMRKRVFRIDPQIQVDP